MTFRKGDIIPRKPLERGPIVEPRTPEVFVPLRPRKAFADNLKRAREFYAIRSLKS